MATILDEITTSEQCWQRDKLSFWWAEGKGWEKQQPEPDTHSRPCQLCLWPAPVLSCSCPSTSAGSWKCRLCPVCEENMPPTQDLAGDMQSNPARWNLQAISFRYTEVCSSELTRSLAVSTGSCTDPAPSQAQPTLTGKPSNVTLATKTVPLSGLGKL